MICDVFVFFFFKQKTAYEIGVRLVGSEMCIRDRVDGVPRTLSLKNVLRHYLAHQKEVVVRRTQHQLDKARKRAHILDGLLVAIANLDAVIKLIRSSEDTEAARTGLMERFGLSEEQAQAIVDLRLRN